MHISIRVDSSRKIGSGHVMRCLTLAEELREFGVTVEFITRDHLGNINEHIKNKDFKVNLLPNSTTNQQQNLIGYEQWVGVKPDIDADETIQIVKDKKVDWLIIDHYALDHNWEERLRAYTKKIMVIDDMANRHHSCDLLFDQTYGRKEVDYKKLVPTNCKLLLGSENALVYPDFSKLRQQALQRRERHHAINNILISMGSMDEENITPRVLDAVALLKWKTVPKVTIVLTSGAAHLQNLRDNLAKYSFPIDLLTDVTNMSELMLESDLAIGAGGTTSWERCCLALPTILIILSENQKLIGENLANVGATITLQKGSKMEEGIKQSIETLIQNKNKYMAMCHNSAKVCDGNGAKRTVEQMMKVKAGDSNDI